MLRVRMLMLLALMLPPALLSSTAHGRSRVELADVVVRPGKDAKRVAQALGQLLKQASRRADWGKQKGKIRLHAKVTHLEWHESDDVLRVTVTVVARIEGGRSARSHIRVGGRPGERKKLEREALRIVADGLVTRLADMARSGDQ